MAQLAVLLFLLLTTSLSLNITLGLRLDIHADKTEGPSNSKVNVTCHADAIDDQEKNAVMLQIGKGKNQIAAVIRLNSKLSFGIGMKKYFMAEGHVGQDMASNYLRVQMTNPLSEDTGVYTCVMFYLDTRGVLKQEEASANFTVANLDVVGIVDFLMERVHYLENLTNFQREKQNDQENTLQIQDAFINNLKSELEKQRKYQDEWNNLQNKSVANLQNGFDDQHDQIVKQSSEVSSMASRLSGLEGITTNQTTAINDIQDGGYYRGVYLCAFSAAYNKKDTYSNGNVMVFRDVISKVGEGYDPNTGMFTAPKTGLYVFHLVLTSYSSKSYIYANIVANDKVMAKLHTYDDSDPDQSSVSTVVELHQGQVAKVVVVRYGKYNYLKEDRFSVFSGYIIQTL